MENQYSVLSSEDIFQGIIDTWSVENISIFLEENEFDINSLNSEGKTIMEVLVYREVELARAKAVLNILLNFGVDLLKMDEQEESLLLIIMKIYDGEFSNNL